MMHVLYLPESISQNVENFAFQGSKQLEWKDSLWNNRFNNSKEIDPNWSDKSLFLQWSFGCKVSLSQEQKVGN